MPSERTAKSMNSFRRLTADATFCTVAVGYGAKNRWVGILFASR